MKAEKTDEMAEREEWEDEKRKERRRIGGRENGKGGEK